MMAFLMGLPTLSPQAVLEHARAGSAHIYDLNATEHWRRAHVPGAAHLEPGAFGPEALPAERERVLVFYCSNPLCRKAPNAARRAKQLGHSNVFVMSAGIQGWLDAGLPIESGA